MTTIEKLTAAEAKLAKAQMALDAMAGGIPEERLLRRDDVSIAERGVAALRRQLDTEMATQAERDAAEQAARKKLDTGAKQLDASNRGLAEAVEAARAALEAVHQRAEAHAALVERWRGELRDLGLSGDTRPDGQPQNTGTSQRTVVVDGREWVRFAPATVLAFAVRRGVKSDRLLNDRLRGIAGLDEWRLERALADAAK